MSGRRERATWTGMGWLGVALTVGWGHGWACEELDDWCGVYGGESAEARYRWLRYEPYE
ncbi:hypothetical protein [Endothiovibrio diazotrophicus]